MQGYTTDVLILGSGVAGLAVALNLDTRIKVTILTKAQIKQSNSYRAQGGIAAAVGEDDSPALHKEDTLRTGVQMCNPRSVDILADEAPDVIQWLASAGMPFDRYEDRWALGREGSHSADRILHAFGDATGAAMTQTLLRCVMQRKNIYLHTDAFAFDLWVNQGKCKGVWVGTKDHQLKLYRACMGVVLATGGCGQVYSRTTNDLVSTGDGLALAYRAGVPLLDMEFVQFHPTALNVDHNPMHLISEAVRGEGARLIDEKGTLLFDPLSIWRDLSPRDVVSRAIYAAERQGRKIFLDTRTLGQGFSRRFPHIYKSCQQAGIDPVLEPIPITPAAHFIMGGVEVDLSGVTSLPHLYACGEVACTGVHGANRLASNSLLEGIVFARRVAEDLQGRRSHKGTRTHPLPQNALPPPPNPKKVTHFERRLQALMWEQVGIIRTSSGLQKAHQKLQEWETDLPEGCFICRNLWITAQAIVRAALWRQESRGGHYRADCPQTLSQWSTRHHRVVQYA